MEDDIKEWENPYYGFPQMIRFAFNPNESSRKKMEELKKLGVTYAFSELLKPKSILKDTKTELHKQFIHEREIIDLLKVIDGSQEDENLLGFLDYDKLKEGEMCRHIVCVLPYRASCDAFEELIKKIAFKNLNSYEVINISGVENEKLYKDTQSVKAKIEEYEKEGKKTITLTVNRMLTGSTVPQWDTMLYLKDTASPQEYDQAIFRLQSQYIKTYKEPNGDTVKYNMKPQTLLVDFNPNRMFRMQEQKSQIYNVNTESNGNDKLEERIEKELRISPIIVVNNKKIVEVEPVDILDAIREYSSERSVLDEATSISIDYSLLDIEAIKLVIDKQNKIGSKSGFETSPTEGEGDDIETEDKPDNDEDKEESRKPQNLDENEKKDYKGKFAMYYARILFFSFLTDDKVKSLQEIIDSFNFNKENKRIASNLDIEIEVLRLFQKHINPFILSELDYKIYNINSLANDVALSPIDRASNAMKKFSRLSDSEIVTPELVTGKMIDAIPEEAFTDDAKILDIASKQGEFVYAVYKKYGKQIADNFYSIPTSKTAFEFTRKVYKLLELDIINIESDYTAYDLLEENELIKDNTIIINSRDMNFDVIVGNPPYHISKERTSDIPIYHQFMDLTYKLASKSVLITPGRFLFNAGKTPKAWNKKMLNDEHLKIVSYESKSSNIFPEMGFMGGIVITLRDKDTKFGKVGVFSNYKELNSLIKKIADFPAFSSIQKIIFNQNKFDLKELYKDFPQFKKTIGSGGREKRLTTSIFSQLSIFEEESTSDRDFCIVGLISNKRTYRYINSKYIDKHQNIDKYKVVLPKSNGSGALGESIPTVLIGEPLICDPQTGYTQSFISFGQFNKKEEAESCLKYIKTKFVRSLLGVLKVTQDNNKAVWRFVPVQDFSSDSDIDWNKSIPEIDAQLYEKYGLTAEEVEFIEAMIKPMEE